MTDRLPTPAWLRDTARLRTDNLCWYCGDGLTGPRPHIDHIHPVAKGGTDELSNLVPACPSCNMAKGHRTVEEWRIRIERKQSGIPLFTKPQLAWLRERGFNVEAHRTTGHRFYFEIHNLADRPLPTPDEAGWLVVELDEEVHELLHLLIRKSNLSKTEYLERLARTTAEELGIRYDPDHPALAKLKRKADRTKEQSR